MATSSQAATPSTPPAAPGKVAGTTTVPPAAASTPPEPPPPAPPPDKPTRQQLIAAALWDRYANIKVLPEGSLYSHEGVCTKCGWHSMQHSDNDAATMISQHILIHWRDVAGSV